jgi:hypothetical protein
MRLARIGQFAAAAFFLSCEAATAAGPYRPFHVGLWSGGAYTDDRNGGFSHCSAGVAYDSGINLFVVSTEAHGWWLGFWNPQWSLTPNASLPVKLRFDARPAVELLGTVAGGQTLLVPMPDDSHLLDRFQRSSQLSVIAQERSFQLDLGGTSAVMSELTSCVRTALALEPHAPPSPTASVAPEPEPAAPALSSAPETASASSATLPPMPAPGIPEAPSSRSAALIPPVAQSLPSSSTRSSTLEMRPPPAPSTAPSAPASLFPADVGRPARERYATELEEVKLARNFLLAARLPNAHLIDTDKPAALAHFSAVWRSDAAVGAVQIVSPGREMTGAGMASDLITVDPRLCKGNFASARSSEVLDNGVVFRAALSCTDAQNELTAQYLITPRQKGGFVVFAVIENTGAYGGAASDGQRIDLLKRAAIQAAGPGD